MSTTTKNLLAAAATVVFAIAATATTVSSAFAQTGTAPAGAAASAVTTPAATGAARTAVAGGALVAIKAEKPGLTRAQVQAEYFEARKNGTLIETEVDSDVAQTKKHVVQ